MTSSRLAWWHSWKSTAETICLNPVQAWIFCRLKFNTTEVVYSYNDQTCYIVLKISNVVNCILLTTTLCREHDLTKILLDECQIKRVQCFSVLILVVHHRLARYFHRWKYKCNDFHSRVLHCGGIVPFHEKWSFVVNH